VRTMSFTTKEGENVGFSEPRLTLTQCEYEHTFSVCQFCKSKGITTCIKLYGRKTEATIRLRRPITPDTTASLQNRDVHLLQFAYAGGSPRPAYTKIFLAFAKCYSPSIQSESLRNAMLACACKWSNPSSFDLDWMERYADLSGKALRKKSEQNIDESDFYAACLLALGQAWTGQKGKVEIHLKGVAAILSIIFQKAGGKQQFVSSLGSQSSIFFFLYDIALHALLRFLPLSPQASLEFSTRFGSIAGLVSYEEREGYHNALQLCPPRNHFTPWPAFLTIWHHYQSLLRAWDLTYEHQHPMFRIPLAVQLLVYDIKSDLESAELVAAVMQIRHLLPIGPEPHDFNSKGARLRVILLLYQSCCLLLNLLTESHCIAETLCNSETALRWAGSIYDLIHDQMLQEKTLFYVSRPTSSLRAVFPDDIVIRIIPIIALLSPNGHQPVSCTTGLRDVACGEEDAISQSSHLRVKSSSLFELLQWFSGRKEVSYAEEYNWEYPWFG